MRSVRPPSRRRRRRAIRVVTAHGPQQQRPIAVEEAHAYEVGLLGAKLIRDHFGAFYQQHLAAKAIEPPLLLGCLVAFWQLVEAQGVALRWPGDHYGELDREATPELSLTMFDDVAPEYLGELGYSICIPRPEYFGLGVQSVLEEWATQPDALTTALWHLFAQTSLSLGVKLNWEPLADAIGEDVLCRINRLRPLPADTPIATLSLYLELPEASEQVCVRDLLTYAFGKTENTLANYTDYEVEAIYMGETDEEWDWNQIAEMARLSKAAQHIEAAYGQWSRRIDADPEREIVKLARALHKARRASIRELNEVSKPLITLLGDSPEQARRFAEMINAL